MCFLCFHVSVTKSTSWWNSCFKIYVECDTHRPPTSVIRYHQLGNTTSSAIKCRHQHLNAFSDTLVNTPRATTRKILRSPTPRPEARIPKAKAILGIESQEKSRFSHGDGGVGLRGWGRDVNVADGWCYARPNLVVAGLMETSYFATSKPSNDIQAYDHSSGSHAFYNNVPARKTVKPLGLKHFMCRKQGANYRRCYRFFCNHVLVDTAPQRVVSFIITRARLRTGHPKFSGFARIRA